tara:strand:+ start:822 stop:1583 length:762 start_codon:yes stop_codon:yes gene_type:complete
MILAILQARLSSLRLPGKVLMTLLGKPMLLHQIERLQHSQMIDNLVVATSMDGSDDAIEKMCLDNNIEVFRGDLNNVLDRFYQCAKKYNPDYIVRLTGDCPVVDWEIIDNVIRFCLENNLDYAVTDENFPDGLDVEVMTMDALEETKQNAVLPSEIEHVSQYIYTRGNRFKNGEFESNRKLSHLRWTVDESEDFVLIEKIYQALYEKNPLFLTNEILDLLKLQPELTKINDSFIRNEGLKKSIQKDKEFMKNV